MYLLDFCPRRLILENKKGFFFAFKAEYALSSDSHTESEPEEQEDKKNKVDNKSKKINKSNNTAPLNSFRNLEDLDQYRRHIDASIDLNSLDDEQFTKDYNSIPLEWTRRQIYGTLTLYTT